MTFECKIETNQVQPVVAMRKMTSIEDLPTVLGEVYTELGAYLGELGEFPAGAPYSAYFNMDMQNLDVEIGIPVGKVVPEKGDIFSKDIPAGDFATCLYIGPYREIEPAYTALSAWITESDRKTSGPAYEVYLNDPGEIAPEDLQTQILFPLENA